MRTKDEQKFSWTGLFVTTAVCFALFSLFLKLINGTPDHSSFFFKIAIVASALTIISYLNDIVSEAAEKQNA